MNCNKKYNTIKTEDFSFRNNFFPLFQACLLCLSLLCVTNEQAPPASQGHAKTNMISGVISFQSYWKLEKLIWKSLLWEKKYFFVANWKFSLIVYKFNILVVKASNLQIITFCSLFTKLLYSRFLCFHNT